MKTVNISVALDKSSPTKILLGRQGENKATKIIFDCNVYAESFGAGTAYLFHQRAPDTCPYPVAIEQDGNTIMWEVSASDTEFAGQGQCELFWYVDDIIAKTQVWSTTVTEALTGTESEEVPEAAQGWVSKVLQAIADIGKVNDEVVKAAVAAYIAENGLPDTGGVGFTSWSYDTDTGYIHLYNEDGEEAIEPLYAPGLGFADLTEDELQQVNTILTRASNYAAQAGQAKEAASASAENATKSAQDAATSAERATQSASAAATSETNASQSASSAAADADLAKQYNDSALKAAGEAAQSLSGAQDAAETAQEAAQDAIAARDGFKVDTTLSQSGQAADAKAVGDALSSLSDEIASTADVKVDAHNTGTDTHSDIRLLISGLTDRLNALCDSDDTTLDQLSEVVAYIKSNRTLIDAITINKVSVSDIINNLTTNVANKPLSAAQGVALKALIDEMNVPASTIADNGKVLSVVDGVPSWTITSSEQAAISAANAEQSATIAQECAQAMAGTFDFTGYLRYQVVDAAPETYEEGVLYLVTNS